MGWHCSLQYYVNGHDDILNGLSVTQGASKLSKFPIVIGLESVHNLPQSAVIISARKNIMCYMTNAATLHIKQLEKMHLQCSLKNKVYKN